MFHLSIERAEFGRSVDKNLIHAQQHQGGGAFGEVGNDRPESGTSVAKVENQLVGRVSRSSRRVDPNINVGQRLGRRNLLIKMFLAFPYNARAEERVGSLMLEQDEMV